MWARILIVLPLVVITSCSGPGPESSTGSQSVLLITLDTTRADHLGLWGGRAFTPELDALAEQSLVFEMAFSSSPLTAPSHASLLTGRRASGHGVRDNGLYVLPDDVPVLAEQAAASGRRTAAFVAAPVLGSDFGFQRGFEVWEEPRPMPGTSFRVLQERRADEQRKLFSRWIETLQDEEPFFAWLHFFDPHFPYSVASDSGQDSSTAAAYAREVTFMDRELGGVLAALRAQGRWEETTVVVVADHGEALGEHGEPTHGLLLFDSTLHVPLLIKPARHSPLAAFRGERVDGLVRVLDLYSTLGREMGWPADPGSDGLDLLDAVRGETEGRLAYFETLAPLHRYGWHPLYGARSRKAKVVQGSREQVFDMESGDEGRSEDESSLASAHYGRLRRLIEKERKLRERSVEKPDRKATRRLEALGYLRTAGRSSSLEENRDLRDPRDMVALLATFGEALAFMDAGDDGRALVLSREIQVADPGNPEAQRIEETALAGLGRWSDLSALLHARLQESPGDEELALRLATTFRRERRWREALETLDRLQSQEARLTTGEIWLASGHSELAEEVARSLLDEDPELASALHLLALALSAQNRSEEAEETLRSALVLDEASFLARKALVLLLVERRRFREADSELELALEIWPEDPELHFARGEILLSEGSSEDAVDSFERGFGVDRRAAHLELGVVVDEAALRLRLARRLLALDRPAEAERVLARGVERSALDADGYYEISQLRFLAGDMEGGERFCRVGLEQEPDHPWLLYNLARLAAVRGDGRRAAELLEKAFERGGEELLAMAREDPAMTSLHGLRKSDESSLE